MATPMKIVVLSSTLFGYRCVEDAILRIPEVSLVGLITTSAEIEISYSEAPLKISSYVDFMELLRGKKIEIEKLEGKVSGEDYLRHIQRWEPDLILALGWYYMVPKTVRSFPSKGCLGIHASLLPKYRGGAPLSWAILHDEKETGVTLFELVKGMDAGDVYGQRSFPIDDFDTIESVYEKATHASVDLLNTALPQIAADRARPRPQDHSEATYVEQRNRNDGLFDFKSLTARYVFNFIRAQSRPYPGAYIRRNGVEIIFWKALESSLASNDHPPGNVIFGSGGNGSLFRVACKDGKCVDILEADYLTSNGKISLTKDNSQTLLKGVFDAVSN